MMRFLNSRRDEASRAPSQAANCRARPDLYATRVDRPPGQRTAIVLRLPTGTRAGEAAKAASGAGQNRQAFVSGECVSLLTLCLCREVEKSASSRFRTLPRSVTQTAAFTHDQSINYLSE